MFATHGCVIMQCGVDNRRGGQAPCSQRRLMHRKMLGGGGAPRGEAGQDGEQALQRQEVHGAQRRVDGEGGLGQQAGDALEQIPALQAAVQIQVHVTDEAGLVAEVEQALQQPGRFLGCLGF